ncbi:MAG: 30S ribosomal protein S6 [Xenococcaceae cyanobacterium]
MQNYEMMYILRPDLTNEQVDEVVNRYQTFLVDAGAANLEVQNRGKRRLAYPIQRHLDGVYVQMNYEADGKQVAPLERAMRLSEEVIRYMTLKVKSPQPPEATGETSTDASEAAEEE